MAQADGAAEAAGGAVSSISFRTKFFYGFGSVAYGVKDGGFRSFLLLYYNQVVGLSAALVSTAIMVALVVDSVMDPIIGQISDNWRSKWGRRHPFMYAAALPVALSYLLLWNPPTGWSEQALFLYIVAVAVIVRTFITVYEIPSSALVAEMTDNYDQRTSILSYRYFFGWWGALGMGIVTFLVFLRPTPEHPNGQLNPEGYVHYGWTAAAVMFAAIMISALGTHRNIPFLKKPVGEPTRGLVPTLKEMARTLSNRPFLIMMGVGLFTAMAQGTSAALAIYFATYLWKLSAAQISILIFDGFFAALFALWVAPKLAVHFGKKTLALWLLIGAVLLGVLPYMLRMAGIAPPDGSMMLVAMLFVFQIVAASMSITKSILVSSMIADAVEDSEVTTGKRSEGLFFSASSLIQKAVSGIGVGVTGVILTVVHFPQGAKPGEVDPQILTNLVLVYLPVLLVVYGLAVLCLTRYPITRSGHAENLRRVSENARAAQLEMEPKSATGAEPV